MKEKKPIWKKWWVWLIVIVTCINILITNLNGSKEDPQPVRNELKEGNISTH